MGAALPISPKPTVAFGKSAASCVKILFHCVILSAANAVSEVEGRDERAELIEAHRVMPSRANFVRIETAQAAELRSAMCRRTVRALAAGKLQGF